MLLASSGLVSNAYTTSDSLHPEGGGSIDLRNFGILSQHYTRRHNPQDLDLNLWSC